MKRLFAGMIVMFISFNSSAAVWCMSYCISTDSKLAALLDGNALPNPGQISMLQATTISTPSDGFNYLVNRCKTTVKQERGAEADGILVQISPLTGKLIAQNPLDGCRMW